MPTSSATSAGQARDNDVEEGDDAGNNGLENGADTVNDGHETCPDGLEDRLDLSNKVN